MTVREPLPTLRAMHLTRTWPGVLDAMLVSDAITPHLERAEPCAVHSIFESVLNLETPSALLGFQVGGIVGHKFLSKYRVGIDLEHSVLRLKQI